MALLIRELYHAIRLGHVGYVLAREGVFARIDPALAPPSAQAGLKLARLLARRDAGDASERLKRAFERLGPSHVKFGQFLATRADVVGQKLADDLAGLQDKMPAFPTEVAKKVIEADLGRPVEALFESFGEPVAAASIAQVHRATVRDPDGTSREVAVKVLRPGVARAFARDLSSMAAMAALAERRISEMQRLKPVEVVDTLARTVAIEMDFRLEAAALSEMAENTAKDPGFRVPTVDWDRTGKSVLTLEWIDATPLSDMAALEKSGHDLPALGRTVIQSFLRHALRDGFFHADMHPGNLMVDAEGRLVALDFGIMGRIAPRDRRVLAEILYGFITRDYRRVAEAHFVAGYVPRTHSVEAFAQALRAIGEPIHSRTADQISMAKLLTLLFEVTGLFDMKTRPELLLLQKTMVVVEGVARKFDPKLNIWVTAEPVVKEWIERNLGPVGRIEDASQTLLSIADAARDLPALMTRGSAVLGQLDRATRDGLTLSPETVAAIGKAEARGNRAGNIALWIIAASLALIVFRLFIW